MKAYFEFDDYTDIAELSRTMDCIPRKGDKVIFEVDAVTWSDGTPIGVDAFDVSSVTFIISNSAQPFARVWLRKRNFQ